MTMEMVPERPAGMSSRKKWLIGCGGCLGALVIVSLIVVVALSMGWNALQKASGDSIKNIFGASYDSSGYTAMGLPLNQKKVKNMAMLFSEDRSSMIFAIDTISSPVEVKILQQGSQEQLRGYFTALGAQFLKGASGQNRASKLKDIQFAEPHYGSLDNGKRYPVVHATVEGESKGKTIFMPSVVMLVPEAGNEVVALIALAPKSSSTEPQPSFKDDQQQLEAELSRLLKDSELDDRLLSGGKTTEPSTR